MKKVNFTLQVSPEKINKEKAKNQLTFQNEFIIINERHRDVSTISDELLIQEKAKNEGLDSPINCVFDRTDKFVVFGSFMGIKIVEVGATARAEEQVATGKAENTERFMNVSLFQGIARVSSQVATAKSGKA